MFRNKIDLFLNKKSKIDILYIKRLIKNNLIKLKLFYNIIYVILSTLI